ncbi:hypothetical protein DSECCO2_351880 [anaerobic digester metagenome]
MVVDDEIGTVGESRTEPGGLGQETPPGKRVLLGQEPVAQCGQAGEALGDGQLASDQGLDLLAGQLRFGHGQPAAQVRGQVVQDALADGGRHEEHRHGNGQEQEADLAAKARLASGVIR